MKQLTFGFPVIFNGQSDWHSAAFFSHKTHSAISGATGYNVPVVRLQHPRVEEMEEAKSTSGKQKLSLSLKNQFKENFHGGIANKAVASLINYTVHLLTYDGFQRC